MDLIDTTINISLINFEKLESAAESLKIARSRLVELLVRRVMEEEPFDLIMFKRVKYQVRDEDDSWYRCHVKFDSSIYENCLDLRKVYKLSVSAIIAFAINNFLDDLLLSGALRIQVESYHHAYLFGEGKPDGVKSFVTFWGVPTQEVLGKYQFKVD
ncbi:MAG: hypothetical protein GY754_27625 [bacterium]|nr:hypothetical protein [bacterium]